MEEIEREPAASYSAALGEHASNPPNPRTEGVPLVVPAGKFKGRTFQLASDEARLKAQFENWVKANALLEIAKVESTGDFEEADKQRDRYVLMSGAGAFTWDGKACRGALKDWPGLCYKMFLHLRRCHPKLTVEDVREIMKGFVQSNAANTMWIAMAEAEGNWHAPERKEEGEESTSSPARGRQSPQVAGGRQAAGARQHPPRTVIEPDQDAGSETGISPRRTGPTMEQETTTGVE